MLRRRVNFGELFSEKKIASHEAENMAYKTAPKEIYFGVSFVLTLPKVTTTITRLSLFSSLRGEVT